MLTLSLAAPVVAMFTRVSALKEAAFITPGFTTALGLDILASVVSLEFRYTQGESDVSNFLLYLDPRRTDRHPQ